MNPNELNQKIEEARVHLEPGWDESRAETNWKAIQAAGAAPRSRTWPLAAAAAVLLGVLAVSLAPSQEESPSPRSQAPAVATASQSGPSDAELILADGTQVTLAEGASFDRAVDERTRIDGRLEGAARFDVPASEGRAFVVHAGGYDFRVLGTRFALAPVEEGVRLEVESGRVEVSREQVVVAVLVAGQARTFEPEPARKEALSDAPRPKRGTNAKWRELVEAGDHAAAYEALEASKRPVPSRPEVLMQAADAARLSGHPKEALVYLDRVAAEFPKHALAPLAAFTAGRTRLDRLGDARGAAASFALARRLAPKGALAQDALAREVEAWSKAGEAGKARATAESYVEKYPEGRRLKSVTLHGGLD